MIGARWSLPRFCHTESGSITGRDLSDDVQNGGQDSAIANDNVEKRSHSEGSLPHEPYFVCEGEEVIIVKNRYRMRLFSKQDESTR